MLFGLPSLEFTASPHGGHLVFQVSNPADMQFDGKPAIQFALPQSSPSRIADLEVRYTKTITLPDGKSIFTVCF